MLAQHPDDRLELMLARFESVNHISLVLPILNRAAVGSASDELAIESKVESLVG